MRFPLATLAIALLLPGCSKSAEENYSLGDKYFTGIEVEKDETKAFELFHLAAKKGHAEAQNIVGYMYYEGKGVPENDILAYAWFNIAASRGIETAKTYKEILTKTLTPQQLEEAQKLSTALMED